MKGEPRATPIIGPIPCLPTSVPACTHLWCVSARRNLCWMVLDHTVKVDGVALWETGRLRTDTFDSIAACVDKWPVLNALFANPSDRIGIAA